MHSFSIKELFPLIEEGIKNGGKYRFYPRGISMLPLIREGKDSVVFAELSKIKKYDIVLYVRDNGDFVLHRVVNIRDGHYDMCGDGQCVVERGIRKDQIKAAVSGIYRDDEFVSLKDPRYLKYVKDRVASIPVRYFKMRIKSLFGKIFKEGK